MKKQLILMVIGTLVITSFNFPLLKTEPCARTGQFEIYSISGGFGVEANIDNIYDTTYDVLWNIEFEALIFINRVSEGIIHEFPGHSSLKIHTDPLFGIGPGFVRVNVWKGDDSVSLSRNCFVIGPFVMLIK